MFPFISSFTHCGDGDDCVVEVKCQAKPYTMALTIRGKDSLSHHTLFCSDATLQRIAAEIQAYYFDRERPGPNGETAEELAQIQQSGGTIVKDYLQGNPIPRR